MNVIDKIRILSLLGVYFGVCSYWRSFGQIKAKGAVHIMFFKNAVNCELAVTVPNLLAMCELAIFYILYQRSVSR